MQPFSKNNGKAEKQEPGRKAERERGADGTVGREAKHPD